AFGAYVRTPGAPLGSGRRRCPAPARLAHPPVLGPYAGDPGTTARRGAPCAGRAALGALPARLAAAHPADRRCDRAHERTAALLSRGARRPRRARLRDAEVPHAPARR